MVLVCEFNFFFKFHFNLLLYSRDVLNQGFDRLLTLPESDKFDCVLCTCIADVDWDGNNEILLGTYGQVIYWQ